MGAKRPADGPAEGQSKRRRVPANSAFLLDHAALPQRHALLDQPDVSATRQPRKRLAPRRDPEPTSEQEGTRSRPTVHAQPLTDLTPIKLPRNWEQQPP